MKRPTGTATDAALPLYAGVKQWIAGRIRSGEWPPRHRIPSESELVDALKVSRMTVNRALRELSLEGLLVRMQGLGSFVAEDKQPLDVFEVRDIAEEIVARGRAHSATVVGLERVQASADIAESLGVAVAAAVFRSILVHREDGVPVQLETRHVNPAVAPHYLDQDLARVTPSQVLTGVGRWTEAEHRVEAVLPTAWESRLLGISRAEPCLLIRRRTWIGDSVASSVRLVFPGGRYRIENRQRSPAT